MLHCYISLLPGNEDKDEDIEYVPHTPSNSETQTHIGKSSKMSYGAIVFVILVIVIVTVLLGWVVYAYRRPTSNSGIFLIEVSCYSLSKEISLIFTLNTSKFNFGF